MSVINTYSGKSFDFKNPHPSAVSIVDIAHALSHVNRFNGHTKIPWSVAQHSILVARMLYLETGGDVVQAYQGLMHDAAEAYIGDVPHPLKCLLPDYQKIEKRVEKMLAGVFKLPNKVRAGLVKEFDMRAMVTERNWLLPRYNPADWVEFEKVPPFDVPPPEGKMTPEMVKTRFLDHFVLLAPPEVVHAQSM